MREELWTIFPRALEQRINHLLDEARPNQMKAFHLYKTCKAENLWQDSYEKFSIHLNDYFARNKSQRRKSQLDQFLNRPMDAGTYEEFSLHFGNAEINQRSVIDVSAWAHQMMRHGCKTNSVIISMDILSKSVQKVTTPEPNEKIMSVEFTEFCEAWQVTVGKTFGKKFDAEANRIVQELKWLDQKCKEQEAVKETPFVPKIYLTQTEIDWILEIRLTSSDEVEAPVYPLSRGADKPRLEELNRIVQLYNLILKTRDPKFMQHIEKIKATLLDRCDGLIADRSR